MSKAHPRVCGENHVQLADVTDRLGSSPRVRGKRRIEFNGMGILGLIPACAGKTKDVAGRGKRARAHPRVCGENALVRIRKNFFPGSSPRVRGKLSALVFDTSIFGLIPACAGKTS